MSWTDLATVWASKKATGLAAAANATDLPRRTWEVVIRFRADVSNGLPLRLVHTHQGVTDTLDVLGVLPDDAFRDQLRLDCIDAGAVTLVPPDEYDRSVTIQSVSESDDGGGGLTRSWSDGATVNAKIDTTGGREFELAMQRTPELTHLVTIAYRTGVTAKHRLKYGARILAIHAVIDPTERHEQLVLHCSEVSPT